MEGMSLSLTLMTLKQNNPEAHLVLWPRIDQKTCLKCIITAGLTPIIIPNKLEGDEVRTDLEALGTALGTHGSKVLAVMSTTSCFAPRGCDRLVEIAKLCKEHNVAHVINNAYGVQSSKFSHWISEASRMGRVDAFVQSTDKNFLVPVGGAIVASLTSGELIDQISKSYPGRASIAPVLDLFITLLSLGVKGFQEILKERNEVYEYLRHHLSLVAKTYGERLLLTPHNPLSFALTLSTFPDPSQLAGMFFKRQISGTRVVTPMTKTVSGFTFSNYGAHVDAYPLPYVNVSATVGLTRSQVDLFLVRLSKILSSCRKQQTPIGEKKEEEEGNTKKEKEQKREELTRKETPKEETKGEQE